MAAYRAPDHDEPLFVISIAAKMVGMHAQSLRNYERLGPARLFEVRWQEATASH